jgi:hypothetical protein
MGAQRPARMQRSTEASSLFLTNDTALTVSGRFSGGKRLDDAKLFCNTSGLLYAKLMSRGDELNEGSATIEALELHSNGE